MNKTVVLAGATGHLGSLIAKFLVQQNCQVRALVRVGTAKNRTEYLRIIGVQLVEVDFNSATDLKNACLGASCVVSALSGLRPVIVDAQTLLLNAAIAAGVPRFIPSDYAIDFTKLPIGTNRNLDVRKEFKIRLDQAPIQVTSILNGAFTDMLTGQAPIVLFKFKKVLYWGNADQKMDFTTIEDAAQFIAFAAMDSKTPRYLRIAGDQISVRDLVLIMNEISKEKFKLLRAGGLGFLKLMIKVTKLVSPTTDDLYPPWQGMQYLQNMYSGITKFDSVDNDRYLMRWTKAKDILAKHLNLIN